MRMEGLLRQLETKAPRTFFKSTLASFEDLANLVANGWIFEPSTGVSNLGQLARAVRANTRDDDLIHVGVNDEIRVVCHDDDLPSGASGSEPAD